MPGTQVSDERREELRQGIEARHPVTIRLSEARQELRSYVESEGALDGWENVDILDQNGEWRSIGAVSDPEAVERLLRRAEGEGVVYRARFGGSALFQHFVWFSGAIFDLVGEEGYVVTYRPEQGIAVNETGPEMSPVQAMVGERIRVQHGEEARQEGYDVVHLIVHGYDDQDRELVAPADGQRAILGAIMPTVESLRAVGS